MSARAFWRGQVRPRLRERRWVAIGGLWVLAVMLGYFGFGATPAPAGGRSFWDTLYLALQLFPVQSGAVAPPVPWELEVARLLAPAVLAATAVGAVLALLREQLQLWGVRGDHIVVCGLGRKGLLLARAFRTRGHRVLVIEKDEGNDRITACLDEGIPVLIGDVTDPAALRKARAGIARYVISVCGQDGTNADVAAHARELTAIGRGGRGELVVFAHMTDLELCRLLRDRVAESGSRDSFRLELFNVFESGARAWLSAHPPFGGSGEQEAGRAHLLVVGAGQMGQSLIVGAARRWLTLHSDRDGRLRITVVDREAARRIHTLRLRHPQLEQVCELVPVETDVTWPEFEEGRFLFDAEGRCDVTAIDVCLDDDARGVTAALALLEELRKQDVQVPIVVRTEEDAGLAAVVQGFEQVRAFPLIDRTCTPEMLLGETPSERVARAIHEDYVRHEVAAGRTPEDNPSMVEWVDLPEGLKESNRRQADHIAVKLRAVDCGYAALAEGDAEAVVFSDEEFERLARMEHERWTAERLFEGWTYAPPPKDLVRKTSPDLVSWDHLDEDEKEKDRAAAHHLPVLLRQAGFRVYRFDESSRTERKDEDGK